MIESNRLCRIMIKDMKTRISKLNIDFDFETYWEIIYLILLAFFVGMRFMLSTMFTIYWPKYFYRTLTVIGVVLVLLHLMMAKDISKKEIAAMLIVTFVFMMSHYVSGYDFLVDLLILILGAYRVNFRNILKTYIAVWSVLLVVTIIGAMTGLAENLVYYRGENGSSIRMALGICYPTDLAAYIVFLMFAYICIRDIDITNIELGIMLVLAIAVFYITDARTDFIIMLLIIIFTYGTKLAIKRNVWVLKKTRTLKTMLIFSQVLPGMFMWLVTVLYRDDSWIMNKLNAMLSFRLSLGKFALDNYDGTFFGQWIYERGLGGRTDLDDYFFIDSSYLSIGLKYGLLMLIMLIFLNCLVGLQMLKKEKWMVIIALMIMALQCMLEHHFIQYWYNPFLIFIFSSANLNMKRKNTHYSTIELLDLNCQDD